MLLILQFLIHLLLLNEDLELDHLHHRHHQYSLFLHLLVHMLLMGHLVHFLYHHLLVLLDHQFLEFLELAFLGQFHLHLHHLLQLLRQ